MNKPENTVNSTDDVDENTPDAADQPNRVAKTSTKRLFSRQHLVQLGLLGVSTVIAMVFVEIALRIVWPIPSGYNFWTPHMRKTFRPNPEITPGISGDSLFAVNSIGIRGDELTPEHKHRILAIGGSTTECLYLDQSETWTALLQDALNEKSTTGKVWVGNAGKSGRNARHHLVALEHLPLDELGIDTVIVLVGANDLGTRLAHDESYDPHYLDKPESEKKLLIENFAGANNPDVPAYKKFAIWRLLRAFKGVVVERYGNQDEQGETLNVWREHRRNSTRIRSELPDLTTALAEFARNINAIIDVARENSVCPILVTQPTLWRPDLPEELQDLLWLGGVGDFPVEPNQPYYAVAALSDAMTRYNRVLLQTCKARNVECIDLTTVLAQDTSVFYDDFHFNESGARQVAQAIAARLHVDDPPASGQ